MVEKAANFSRGVNHPISIFRVRDHAHDDPLDHRHPILSNVFSLAPEVPTVPVFSPVREATSRFSQAPV